MQIQNGIVVFLSGFLLLSGCGGSRVAPVDDRDSIQRKPTQVTNRDKTATSSKSTISSRTTPAIDSNAEKHIVKSGETLYSISWSYNQDYKDIAEWNHINPPFTIYPGQTLVLKPLNRKQGTPLTQIDNSSKTPNTVNKPVDTVKPPPVTTTQRKQITVTKKPESTTASLSGPVKWRWPTTGQLLSSNSVTSKKGIDIAGRHGQAILAAADGEVVYSGSGLLGYGRLIIIKHNQTYLSAYAYNSELFVKEGDQVKAGQKISLMGQNNTGQNVLHFEIRKNGKPVNPNSYLPKTRT